jgi:hypothetical protein
MAFGRRHNDDSGSDAGSENRKEKKPKSRKPPNTAFRQQRLLAYAPILTPKTVLPLFFAVGIIFGPIGGLLLYASSKVCSQGITGLMARFKKLRLITRIARQLPIRLISQTFQLILLPLHFHHQIQQAQLNHNGNLSSQIIHY